MATALYSLFTGRKFRQKVAMTGELSLIGKVLPVGGIKEKILAAKRAGITELLLPKLNEKDVHDVPDYALKGMTIHYVSHVDEVFRLALEKSEAPKRPTRGKIIRVRAKPRVKAKKKSHSVRSESSRA